MLINSNTPHITKNNSTIFKNINLTKIISQYSQLNKAVERYNNIQNKSQSFQTAYNNTLQKSQSNMGMYLASLNGAKASITGYVKYLISAKASTVALQLATNAMNIALKAGVIVGVSLLVNQINKWVHAQEEARRKSIELTNAYKEQQSSLDEQIEKYKELKKELDSGNLSVNESRSIKEQLLEIQKNLIESYGDEVSNIDLVNGKYKEQLGLLNALSKEKASTYVKENRSAYEDAKKELEKTRSYKIGSIFSYEPREGMSDEQKQLYEYIKSYSDLFEIRSMYDTSTFSNSDYAPTLFVNANADETKVIIDKFYDDIEKYIKDNNLQLDYDSLQIDLSKISSDIETDEELKEYREIYDEFMKAEIVRNDTLRPLYQESIQAVEDYNKALSSGEGVEEAKTKLDSLQQSVQSVTEEMEDSQSYQDVFNGIYDGINKTAENAYKLDQAFKNNTAVQGYAEQLRGLMTVDLKNIRFDNDNLETGEQAFKNLLEALGYTDLTQEQIQNLINKLEELGYVIGDVTKPSYDVFHFDQSAFNEEIKSYEDGYSKLISAQEEWNESKAISASTFADLQENGLLEYLTFTSDGLEVNTGKLLSNAQSCKDKAVADLHAAMTSDLLAIAMGNTESISAEAQSVIAQLGENTEVAGNQAMSSVSQWATLGDTISQVMADIKGEGYVSGISEEQKQQMSSVYDFYKKLATDISNIDITLGGSDNLAKTAKEILESTLAVHKAELDAGIIDLDTYLKKCNDLLDDARDKAIITAAEYWDYQKEVLENQKNVYNKTLSAINRRYDKEIDSIEKVIDALEKQNEALEKQLAKYDSAISAITKFLDTQKDLLQDNIDGIEAENDAIQDEIDGYDQLLSAVTLVIDAKREAVEADKQAIQDRIDALREENDEAKRAYELEQAKYELERLRNSRTKKLYVQGQGYIFDVDHSAIREQEDSVADLELDATTSALEKEQELLDNILEQLDATEQKWQDIADVFENNKALEKAKELLGDNFKDIILEGDNKSINDILNAYIGAQGKLEDNTLIIEDYEKRMEQLDAIAKKWENVANIKEETENAINAAELLGKEWQEIVLADRAENYEEFCAKYLEIQSKIDDNTSMIESYEEKVEYYENLKQQWSDIADTYKYAEEDMYLTQVLGSNAEADLLNGRLDTLENFKVQYMAIEQAIVDAAWNSANEQNKALASIGSGSTDGKGDISGGSSLSEPTQEEPTQEEIVIVKKTLSKPSKKNMLAQVFHDGIKKGYPDASVPKDKKLETLQKLATEEIPLKNDEIPVIARNDELLINEPQQLMLVENFQKLMGSMSVIPWNVPIMNTNPLANVGMIKREQPISISIGDIHLHEVQNVDSFADAIVRQLPNKVLQAVHRR